MRCGPGDPAAVEPGGKGMGGADRRVPGDGEGEGVFLVRVFTRFGQPWRARITHASSGESAPVRSGAELVAFIEAHLTRKPRRGTIDELR